MATLFYRISTYQNLSKTFIYPPKNILSTSIHYALFGAMISIITTPVSFANTADDRLMPAIGSQPLIIQESPIIQKTPQKTSDTPYTIEPAILGTFSLPITDNTTHNSPKFTQSNDTDNNQSSDDTQSNDTQANDTTQTPTQTINDSTSDIITNTDPNTQNTYNISTDINNATNTTTSHLDTSTFLSDNTTTQQTKDINQTISQDTNPNSPIAQKPIYTIADNTIDLQNFQIDSRPIASTRPSNLTALYKPTQQGRHCQGVWQSVATPKNNLLNHNYAFADYGYYDNVDYAELSGNVVLYQNGQKVLADKLTVNTKTSAISANGQVFFSDDNNKLGLMGISKTASFDGQDKITASDIAFASQTLNAHGYAKTLNANQNRYVLSDTMFSTCPPNDKKWYIQASNLTLDKDSGRGIAKHTTLKIKDVPVLYLPYFNFPIDNRRTTGFLLPNIGLNSEDGLQIDTPYYINIAPNYDATITPTVYAKKNPRLVGEFRFLTKNAGSGQLQAGYLPNDKRYFDKTRMHLFFDYNWQSAKIANLSAYANYRYVSDNRYLSDFNKLRLSNTPLNLPRRLGVSYFNDYVNVDLRAESYQTLKASDLSDNAILDKQKPYARLPKLSIDYRLPPKFLGRFDKVLIEGTSQSAYFKKSINDGSEPEKSGVRLFNRLSVSQPFVKSWGYLTPKISATHLYTHYDEDSQIAQNLNKNNISRAVFVPQLSLDMGLYLQKSGSPFGLYKILGGYQVLSPRIKYLYSSHKDQSDMPNFETIRTPVSYEQLLSDTWFLGYDRILDIHAVTPALNYRYIDNQGKTRFDASVAKQLHFDNSQLYLDNQPVHTNLGLVWQTSVQPWQNLWFDTSGSLTDDYHLNAFVGQVRYAPSSNQLYNFGIVKRQDNRPIGQYSFSALTASAIFPINDNWQVLMTSHYDNKRHQLVDATIGFNYEDCCIGVSVYGREYRHDLNLADKPNRSIMAELRLTGLTGRGGLYRLLNSKILGFDNLSWADK